MCVSDISEKSLGSQPLGKSLARYRPEALCDGGGGTKQAKLLNPFITLQRNPDEGIYYLVLNLLYELAVPSAGQEEDWAACPKGWPCCGCVWKRPASVSTPLP